MDWINGWTIGGAVFVVAVVAFWRWALSDAECGENDHDWKSLEDDQHAYRLCHACGRLERFEYGEWEKVT